MESVGITILGFIVLSIVFAIIKGIGNSIEKASNSRKYAKAVVSSTGLEKVRLLVRREAPMFSTSLKKDDGSTWFHMTLPTSTAHLFLSDGFYGLMKDTFEELGKGDSFDDFASSLSTDYTKQRIISARIFGIAFGITISKAANLSGKKIKKTAVKKYLESCKFDEIYKKEIVRMTATYIDFEQDKLFGAHSEAAFTSQELGTMAYALVDEKLGKGNFADPTFSTHMNMAIAMAYKETPIDETTIKEFQDVGFIA